MAGIALNVMVGVGLMVIVMGCVLLAHPDVLLRTVSVAL